MSEPGDDLSRLLAARQEIDRTLLERHSREVAVLFTDIVGSTAFYEAKGDIEGLARVHRHNDVLFPLVERFGGRVVKTIGDAIMAVFEEPARGVDCAAEMQRALEAAQAGEAEPIEIRIGVHAGRVLVDGDDVYGDTVNTAARVAGAANGREVLLSESLYRALPASARLAAEPRGALSFKGKSEPIPVVSLHWRAGREASTGEAPGEHPGELFVLELGLGARGLKVAILDGERDKGTVKAYGEVDVTRADLEALTGHFDALSHQGGARAYLEELCRAGGALFSRALTERAKASLVETRLSFLRLHLDDDLVHLPWELLYDGEQLLALRFAVGRMVAARAERPPPPRASEDAERGRLVVVANPSGDLPAAAREGHSVARLLEDARLGDVRLGDARSGEVRLGEVRLIEGPLSRARFLAEVAGCRMLHFAGHTRRDEATGRGGFLVEDGVVTAEELGAALGEHAPSLVFANSCHASTSQGWHESQRTVGGLAASLLLRGVRHYLAPAWSIPDDDAAFFALRFYEHALAGVPFGEAVRRARVALREGPGRPLSFAGYVLYGDPRERIAGTTRSPRDDIPVTRGASGPHPVAPASGKLPQSALAPAAAPVSRPTPPAPISAAKRFVVGFAAAALVAGGVVAAIVWPKAPATSDPPPDDKPGAAALPAEARPSAPATGPIRLSILPFKNVSQEEALAFLEGGFVEVLVTDFGLVKDVQLIERGQIDVDIAEIEFSQSRYVDPGTRAALGRIKGAEVVVLGGFQRAGDRIRATARFVHVETGEILAAVRADRPADEVFDLQDALAVQVRAELDRVRGRLRP